MQMNYFIKNVLATTMLLTASLSIVSCQGLIDAIVGSEDNPSSQVQPSPTPVVPTPDDALSIPLTLEAVSGTMTVTFRSTNSTGITIEYSTDDGATWTSGTASDASGKQDIDNTSNPLTITGSKILLRGNNATYSNNMVNNGDWSNYYYSNFACSDDCYIYGNVMSLIKAENFATLAEFPPLVENTSGVFVGLFKNNAKIKNHESKKLSLPATKLVHNCYSEMFSGCTGLTKAIELPATTLAMGCYMGMFGGCTNLATVPQLKATTTKAWCYASMFSDCTSLTMAPELIATELDIECYANMFSGCTKLETAPELPATTLAFRCYGGMFSNCTSLASAPQLPATILADDCYSGMFSECTSLTSTPELPATVAKESCYSFMFSGCTGLTSASAILATTLAKQCYLAMFDGCSNLVTPPALPATELKESCYRQMFSQCKSLTTAPELPATKLVEGCYYNMFWGCSSLNSVTCHATDISAEECVNYWLSDVAASGTFNKPSTMTSWTTGSDGIPTGWTVVNQ